MRGWLIRSKSLSGQPRKTDQEPRTKNNAPPFSHTFRESLNHEPRGKPAVSQHNTRRNRQIPDPQAGVRPRTRRAEFRCGRRLQHAVLPAPRRASGVSRMVVTRSLATLPRDSNLTTRNGRVEEFGQHFIRMQSCDFPPLGLPQWFPRFCTTFKKLHADRSAKAREPPPQGGWRSRSDADRLIEAV